ncbi:APC family permease [Piscirickettsia litoralis]|uniref:Amino acid permease n=1 Tax=Piscirickettsia litoralis TaxID=1891921 RepID=A0ABX3A2X1_9GAMM|nr:APC family permease [Piscirickettsia litoralis]ODN41800.1 amino acid permease [Piscirickettsia litoralis]
MIKLNKHKIGLIPATFIGISAIIGSGWLFAPYRAAQAAGGASLLSWIVGAGLVLLLALCFAEIASLYPRRGLTAVISTISHNKYFGFPFAIANWLGIVAVIPMEADATIQYLISLFPSISPYLWSHSSLTPLGLTFSLFLIVIYCLINYWGVRSLTKANNAIAVFKIFVPLITAIIAISVSFHASNFDAVEHTYLPYGWSSVFTTIITTGIIVAFNGFQSIISFSSEIKNPKRNIPLSLVLSIVICLIIYLLLQVSFIGALPPDMLKKGWHHLDFQAPMVQLAGLLGLHMIMLVLYVDAMISPLGTALAYTGSSTRMLTAMSRERQVPRFFDHVHPQYGVSRRSLIFNIALAIVFLFSFRSWASLAQILSLFHILAFMTVPLALVVFRKTVKPEEFNFKVIGGRVISALLFVIFSYLFVIGHFPIVFELVALITVFQVIFIALQSSSLKSAGCAVKKCGLLFVYFYALTVLCWLAPNNGGHMAEGDFFILVAVIAGAFFFLLTRVNAGTQHEATL